MEGGELFQRIQEKQAFNERGKIHQNTFTIKNKTDTGSRVCSDYISMLREWKRSIDRLTEKNTARWIDG